MTGRRPSGAKGKPDRLLRAHPLVAEPLPEEGPPSGATPPRPIPVEGDTAAPRPPAPIPVEAGPGAESRPAPIPVQPSGAGTGAKAAPILLTPEQKQRLGAGVEDRGWARGRKAVGVREEIEERAEEGTVAVLWRDFLHQHRSWAVSAFVHTVIVVVLGLMTISLPRRQIQLVAFDDTPEDFTLEDVDVLPTEGPDVENLSNDIVDRVEPESLQPMVDMKNAAEGIDAASVELIEESLNRAPYNDILCELGRGTGAANARGTGKGRRGLGYGLNGTGGGLGGRGGRRGNALGRGASKQSEAAVDLALKWLAEHQLPDGGWSFNHQVAPTCQGKCPNPGQMPEARNAATALGVLPFLGAGQTHQVGKYQRTVGAGLNYLIRHMRMQPAGGSLFESGGRMYSHGLATIALCEAYGMQVDSATLRKMRAAAYDGSGEARTGESSPGAKAEVPVPGLGQAAQAALNFLMYAQDPKGGGWRYEPKQPGDTSVVGWALMGLLSGKMAYLRVSPACFLGATNFLNYVQMDEYGSDYGYTHRERPSQATQAIGLLSRMYLGWTPDHPGIIQGVQAISAAGPSRGNMYYNYYATQVLHHYGGEHWKQWNPRMRDSLVASQSKAGHTAGSWHFAGGDRGASKGGRLYCTALAAMTLEVYYRHMPLYRKDVLSQAEVQAAEKKEQERPVDEF